MTDALYIAPIRQSDRDDLIVMAMPYYAEVAPAIIRPKARAIDRYWLQKGRFPFWIQLDQTRIGFALVYCQPDGITEMAEFTVLPAYRRQGHAQAAAALLFARFPGRWTLGISEQSDQAAAFWQTCLPACPIAHQITRTPPLTPFQLHGYDFTISGLEQ